jgi:hypothetical protein
MPKMINNTTSDHFKISGTALGSIIRSDTIMVLAYPTKPHNYTWCKYCTEKGKIIRFQFFEVFRVVHIDSFLHWKKETLRKFWGIFDDDTWEKHEHVLQEDNVGVIGASGTTITLEDFMKMGVALQ